MSNCEAFVHQAGSYDRHGCSRKAQGESLGVRLCTQHRVIAERHRKRHPGHHPYYMPQPRITTDAALRADTGDES